MNAAFKRGIRISGSALALGLMLCGCATISEQSHAYLGTPSYAATNPGRVQVLAAEPTRPKVRLGEITLSIEGNPSRQAVEEKFKVAAARLGADAVFIVLDKTYVYPVVYWDYWWGYAGTTEYWQRNIIGVAFKYT